MAAAWVSGLAVLAMIYTLGHVSGAHFNPAVTAAFAVTGQFPRRDILPYLLAQAGGGITAAGIVAGLFGRGYGVHIPADGNLLRAAGTEIVLSFLLMLVIIAVATDTRAHGAIPGLAIGMTVVFCVLIGGAVSGGSMNPIRSLAPALFSGGKALSAVWVYLLAPVLGATLGSVVYDGLRVKPHPNRACESPEATLEPPLS
jgi:aquaporin NIP